MDPPQQCPRIRIRLLEEEEERRRREKKREEERRREKKRDKEEKGFTAIFPVRPGNGIKHHLEATEVLQVPNARTRTKQKPATFESLELSVLSEIAKCPLPLRKGGASGWHEVTDPMDRERDRRVSDKKICLRERERERERERG